MSSTVKVKSDAAIKKALADESIKEIKIEGQPLFLLPRKHRKSATWYLSFKKNGRQQASFAKFPDINLKEAIEMKPIIMANMLAKQTVFKSKFKTIGELFDWFNKEIMAKGEHRKTFAISQIKNHLRPYFGDINIADFTKLHVYDFFRDQEDKKCKPSSTEKRFGLLKQVLSRAKRLDLIESNILFDTKVTDFTEAKSLPREGRLKLRHISDVFPIINEYPNETVRVFNMFCVLNGTRLMETAMIKWSEVDFKNKEVTLIAENVKNRQEHVLPMTQQVYQMLLTYRQWQSKRYQGDYLFPSTRSCKYGHISSSTAKSYVERVKDSVNGDWSCHDYRKLIKSMLTELDIENFIGERVINHKMSDLELAYTQAKLKKKILKALNAWHDYLDKFSEIKVQNWDKSVKKKKPLKALSQVA